MRTPRKDRIVLDEAARTLLSRFRDSIILPLANTDADKWPIRSGRISRLCLDEFSREFFDDIHILQEQQWSISSIAALFGTPSRLWRMSHHLLNGLRLLATPLEIQQEAILTLLDIISYLKYGDLFCTDGTNVIWSPEEFIKIGNDLRPIDGDNAARLVHQLGGVLWAYAESLYFVAHELSVEIHGPYKLANGNALLVRDFFALQPSELWPTMSLLTCPKVRIITIYKRFNAHLDVYNNLYVDPGTRLINDMLFCEVLIGDTRANLSQVQQITLEASKIIETITSEVNKWSLEQVARHYIQIFWWRKAALSKAVHKAWQPPEKVLNRVVEKEIPDPTFVNPSLAALYDQYNLL